MLQLSRSEVKVDVVSFPESSSGNEATKYKVLKIQLASMPGIVQVKVVSARDLPIMDRSSELTDAFVEVGLKYISNASLSIKRAP